MGRAKVYEVREIKGKSGEVVSYEGKAFLKGKTKRKRFPDWENANAFVERTRMRELNALNERRTAATTLTDAEISDAEQALRTLRVSIPDRTKGLSWVVHEFVKTYRGELRPKKLSLATKDFLEEQSKKNRPRQLEDHKATLRKLKEVVGDKDVHRITIADINEFLATRGKRHKPGQQSDSLKTGIGPKTFNNITGNLRRFFNWAVSERLVPNNLNPLAAKDFEQKKVAEPRREILTSEAAAALMSFAETWRGGVLVNYFAFALFAGIRPDHRGEIAKLGINYVKENLIAWDLHSISLPGKYTKTNQSRTITIQPALKAFIESYPLSQFPIVPEIPENSNSNSRSNYLKNAREAFVESCPIKIPHDAARHSFCSYHIKLSGSIADTALESGDSEEIIRRHYLKKVSPEEATLFWNIRPKLTQFA